MIKSQIRWPVFSFWMAVAIGLAIYQVKFSPHARVRKIQREYVSAFDQLNSSPPGVLRVERLVDRIKVISNEPAPLEVQEDLRNYANALGRAVETPTNSSNCADISAEVSGDAAKIDSDFKRYK